MSRIPLLLALVIGIAILVATSAGLPAFARFRFER